MLVVGNVCATVMLSACWGPLLWREGGGGRRVPGRWDLDSCIPSAVCLRPLLLKEENEPLTRVFFIHQEFMEGSRELGTGPLGSNSLSTKWQLVFSWWLRFLRPFL